MQFNCDRDVLLKEIDVANEIITSRNSISILANVLLEARDDSLIIMATDLKVSFETRIPAIIGDPGITTVYCAKLLNILRSLPVGDIRFNQEDDGLLHLTCGLNIQFHLNCLDPDKYPELPVPESSQYFTFPQSEFIEMISHTIFAIGNDETRYYMNGVCLDRDENKLIMAATDGRRLSYAAKPIEGEIPEFSSVIIPPKALALIRKRASKEGTLDIALSDKIIYIKFDNQKISSSLIEGKFPNYNRVVPEDLDKEIKANRTELRAAINRISLLLESSSKRIYMTVTNDNIHLRAEESNVGIADEDVSCQFTGDEILFIMNHHYLTEPLEAIDSEQIVLKFTNIDKAVVLKSIPEDYFFHVIMPINKS